jgi:hypothetical protein
MALFVYINLSHKRQFKINNWHAAKIKCTYLFYEKFITQITCDDLNGKSHGLRKVYI